MTNEQGGCWSVQPGSKQIIKGNLPCPLVTLVYQCNDRIIVRTVTHMAQIHFIQIKSFGLKLIPKVVRVMNLFQLCSNFPETIWQIIIKKKNAQFFNKINQNKPVRSLYRGGKKQFHFYRNSQNDRDQADQDAGYIFGVLLH